MPSIRKSRTRFSPWLTIVAVYLVLGLAGRTILWFKFGSRPMSARPGCRTS